MASKHDGFEGFKDFEPEMREMGEFDFPEARAHGVHTMEPPFNEYIPDENCETCYGNTQYCPDCYCNCGADANWCDCNQTNPKAVEGSDGYSC